MHEGENSKPTITAQDAAAKNEKYVRELAAALPKQVNIELLYGDQGPCSNSTGTGFEKRVQPNISYWLRGLDAAQNNTYFDTMKAWLPSHGWTVEEDKRPNDMFLNARRTDDGFTMSLQANKSGALSLGVSSPCVWPKGVPEA